MLQTSHLFVYNAVWGEAVLFDVRSSSNKWPMKPSKACCWTCLLIFVQFLSEGP